LKRVILNKIINKRSNILLEKEANRMIAVICDFGIARVRSEMNVIFSNQIFII